MIWSLIILMMANIACGLVGPILVLKNMVMSADAISHSVLLGIVLAFFLVGDLNSPWLLIGASLFGLFTLWLIEFLVERRLVKADGAIGLVFPIFFATAVVLISRFARNVHLDTDIVLMGEVIFAPLNKIHFLGLTLPKNVVSLGLTILISLVSMVLFYKELKFSIFDEESFKLAGFNYRRLHHYILFLVSLTCVACFDAIGAILVIAFLVTPTASVYLFSKRFDRMIIFSILCGMVSSILGYILSIHYNVSMQMMVASISFIIFLISLTISQVVKIH